MAYVMLQCTVPKITLKCFFFFQKPNARRLLSKAGSYINYLNNLTIINIISYTYKFIDIYKKKPATAAYTYMHVHILHFMFCVKVKNLYKAFMDVDCVQLEVNPLAETPQGMVRLYLFY